MLSQGCKEGGEGEREDPEDEKYISGEYRNQLARIQWFYIPLVKST